jgi:hypothetical protein
LTEAYFKEPLYDYQSYLLTFLLRLLGRTALKRAGFFDELRTGEPAPPNPCGD